MKRILFLLPLILIIAVGCSQDDKDETEYEDYVYTKYELDVKDKVKLGKEDADNELVLAFDYSCSWCHKWMTDILPEVEKNYIEKGTAHYVAQPLALLNQTSLQLAHVDYYFEINKPDRLFEFQLQMAEEAMQGNLESEGRIAEIITEYGVNVNLEELEKENPDPISISRNYTKNLGVKAVPTLYINGIKVYNAFDLEEISKIINGDIKENGVIQVPVQKS